MRLIAIGLNHKTAPLEVREKLALEGPRLEQALESLKGIVPNGAILSTCNRTEVYATLNPSRGEKEALLRFLKKLDRSSHSDSAIPRDISHHLYTYMDSEAVEHLFKVASGLDSMILGEAQILGQVRLAMLLAQKQGCLSFPISRLFNAALRIGKKVRREAGVGRYVASVSSASVQLAREVFGDLEKCTVLVISAGETGKLAARALKANGAARVLVTNRTFQRAVKLAQDLEGEALPFSALEEALARSDIVISATASPSFIIRAPQVEKAIANRNTPLFFIDIAVPRDIDPEVRRLPGVFVYDIDDLQGVAQNYQGEQEAEVLRGETIIAEEVQRFMSWWRSLEAVPVICTLRRQAEKLRERELARALKKLPNLSEEDKAYLQLMTRSLVNKLLHRPIVFLKENASNGSHLRAAQEMFGGSPHQD